MQDHGIPEGQGKVERMLRLHGAPLSPVPGVDFSLEMTQLPKPPAAPPRDAPPRAPAPRREETGQETGQAGDDSALMVRAGDDGAVRVPSGDDRAAPHSDHNASSTSMGSSPHHDNGAAEVLDITMRMAMSNMHHLSVSKGKGKSLAAEWRDMRQELCPRRSRSPVRKAAPPTIQSMMRKGKGLGSKKGSHSV